MVVVRVVFKLDVHLLEGNIFLQGLWVLLDLPNIDETLLYRLRLVDRLIFFSIDTSNNTFSTPRPSNPSRLPHLGRLLDIELVD